MIPSWLRLRFPCIMLLLMSALLPLEARAVTVATAAAAAGPLNPQARTSMVIVEGHPAIIWQESGQGGAIGLRYARALDADGTRWGAPVTLANLPSSSPAFCLRAIDGRPAVCFSRIGGLSYMRAADSTGTVWNAAVDFFLGGGTVQELAMESVAGTAAIVFSVAAGAVMYVRANDAEGTQWGALTPLAAAFNTSRLSLRMTGGRPSIIYFTSGSLWFRRANDVTGTDWQAERKLADNTIRGALVEAAGHPAVCFSGAGGLLYMRAGDPDGTWWPVPVAPALSGITGGQDTVIEAVNGKPLIIWGDLVPGPAGTIKYTGAATPEGAASAEWSPVRTVEAPGHAGRSLSLLEVNGHPAIAWHSITEQAVKFVRALDPGGGVWPLELKVRAETDPGRVIADGGTLEMGALRQGNGRTISLEVENPSATREVKILAVTLDGMDAAEFSFTDPGAVLLPPGGKTTISVTHTSASEGAKNAALHIAFDGDAANPYDILFTARTMPVILLEIDSQPVVNGGTINLPVVPAGGTDELTLTVRNTGEADLRGLAVTVEGPNASEYSVSQSVATTVPPAGFADFTVRHAPASAGGKTATLRVRADNAAADVNPYPVNLVRLAHALDKGFRPLTEGRALRTAVEAGGRILVAGDSRLMAFRADGTPDPAFFAPALTIDSTARMEAIAVQLDGRILIGGGFTHINGRDRKWLARLLPDGTLDETFAPVTENSVLCVAALPDGKVIAGEYVNTAGGIPRTRLARYHADGTRDESFTPEFDYSVRCLAPLRDGRLLAGGSFVRVNGVEARNMVRLNADGSTDETFFFSGTPTGAVYSLAVQPDGKILAGVFLNRGLMRLLPDGAPDPVQLPACNGSVNKVLLQTDGRFLAAGTFSTVGGEPRSHIARFNADGTLEAGFKPDPDQQDVFDLAAQEDGRLILAGDFTIVSGESQAGLARLVNETATPEIKVSGNNAVTWLRGGSSPEAEFVFFDIKPDGAADWQPLGEGSRIPGGWKLTGPALPARGTIRAQAMAGGSILEDTQVFSNPLAAWRVQHFNTSANAGDAADDADPDHDGLTNFAEFAFGLSPVDRGSSALPAFTLSKSGLTASFTAPEGRDADVIYRAAWSSTMAPGTWANIPDTGAAPLHVFQAPATGERVFVRWEVSWR